MVDAVEELRAQIAHTAEENEHAENENCLSYELAGAVALHRDEPGVPFLLALGASGGEFRLSGDRAHQRHGVSVNLGIGGGNRPRKVDCPLSGGGDELVPPVGKDPLGPDVVAHTDGDVRPVPGSFDVHGHGDADIGAVVLVDLPGENCGGPVAVGAVAAEQLFGNFVFLDPLGGTEVVVDIFARKGGAHYFELLYALNGDGGFKPLFRKLPGERLSDVLRVHRVDGASEGGNCVFHCGGAPLLRLGSVCAGGVNLDGGFAPVLKDLNCGAEGLLSAKRFLRLVLRNSVGAEGLEVIGSSDEVRKIFRHPVAEHELEGLLVPREHYNALVTLGDGAAAGFSFFVAENFRPFGENLPVL